VRLLLVGRGQVLIFLVGLLLLDVGYQTVVEVLVLVVLIAVEAVIVLGGGGGGGDGGLRLLLVEGVDVVLVVLVEGVDVVLVVLVVVEGVDVVRLVVDGRGLLLLDGRILLHLGIGVLPGRQLGVLILDVLIVITPDLLVAVGVLEEEGGGVLLANQADGIFGWGAHRCQYRERMDRQRSYAVGGRWQPCAIGRRWIELPRANRTGGGGMAQPSLYFDFEITVRLLALASGLNIFGQQSVYVRYVRHRAARPSVVARIADHGPLARGPPSQLYSPPAAGVPHRCRKDTMSSNSQIAAYSVHRSRTNNGRLRLVASSKKLYNTQKECADAIGTTPPRIKNACNRGGGIIIHTTFFVREDLLPTDGALGKITCVLARELQAQMNSDHESEALARRLQAEEDATARQLQALQQQQQRPTGRASATSRSSAEDKSCVIS